MDFANFEKQVPRNGTVALLSDFHEGLITQSDAIGDAIERCMSKNSKIILGGDLVEGRTPDHPYYDKTVDEGKYATIQAQAEGIAKKLLPARKNILAVMAGNHERGVRNVMNVSREIVKDLGIEVPHGMLTLKAKIGEDSLFYFHPEKWSCNSQAGDAEQRYHNDVRKIRRKLYPLAGDCIVMAVAHIHKLRLGEPIPELALIGEEDDKQTYTNPDMYRASGNFPETQRWYCATGSFLRTRVKGVTSYSEAGGYPPTEIGYIEIQMKNGRVAELREIKL